MMAKSGRPKIHGLSGTKVYKAWESMMLCPVGVVDDWTVVACREITQVIVLWGNRRRISLGSIV